MQTAQTTTRQHDYLAIGDTVNWTAVTGLPPRQATVTGIKLADSQDTEEVQNVTVVQWKQIELCTLQLSNGKIAHGSRIEPFHAQKFYQYPEAVRCN